MQALSDFTSKWTGRMSRQKQRLELILADTNRSASWYLRGGQHFFGRYSAEIARAHRWVFIVGCNNSGTSLLQSILEQTGQVSTFPVEGQRYTKALERSERRGFERVWSEYLDALRLTESDDTSQFPRLLHDWMGALDAPLKELIVEKTPANVVRMRWLQRVFPNSHFIGLVRNGYAVTEGIVRKGGKDAARGAKHWNLVNQIMFDDAKHIDRFMLLPYEDLVSGREEVVAGLGEFLNIPVDAIDRAMGQEYGFTTVNGSHRQSVSDLNSAGLSRLSREDFAAISRAAEPMLKQFGYFQTC